MRILNDMVMVEVNLDQKQTIKMKDFEIILPVKREQLNENGRETNPVIAKVYLAGKNTPFIKGDFYYHFA